MSQHAQQKSAQMKMPETPTITKPPYGSEDGPQGAVTDIKVHDSGANYNSKGWAGMDTAPKNGTPLVLRAPNGKEHEAYWRHTRAFNSSSWRPTGYWCPKFGVPAPIGFEPAAWRHYRSNEGLTAERKEQAAE